VTGCSCGALGRRSFLTGAALAATLPLAGCDAAVPDWLADLLVPETMAAELGAQAFREILRDTPPINDAGLQRRLAGVGERIVAASGATWPDWQFLALAGPQLNAFALPGGKVGVFTGMRVIAGPSHIAQTQLVGLQLLAAAERRIRPTSARLPPSATTSCGGIGVSP
jgi:hypothetical protein